MYKNGDDDVKGIVQWIILEYLLDLDYDTIRCKLYKYLSQDLYEATKEVELYLKDICDKCYHNLHYRLHSAR